MDNTVDFDPKKNRGECAMGYEKVLERERAFGAKPTFLLEKSTVLQPLPGGFFHWSMIY